MLAKIQNQQNTHYFIEITFQKFKEFYNFLCN